MAEAKVTIRFADLERMRLFMWELRQLEDEMRVMASPHAERLTRVLDRWAAGDDFEDKENV